MMEPLLIVLDLDETLVHASPTGMLHHRPVDFWVGPYPVYKRPGVDQFLEDVINEFQVGVWTSASPSYAKSLVKQLFGELRHNLEFVWDSDRCTIMYDRKWGGLGRHWEKNLKKVRRRGFDLKRVVAVDDTPSKYSRHYGNLIRVEEYYGGLYDDELPALMHYLRDLNEESNVRRVEKRWWRDSYS